MKLTRTQREHKARPHETPAPLPVDPHDQAVVRAKKRAAGRTKGRTDG